MKTETENLSEEELSLKKLQRLLLSEDRTQLNNELKTLQNVLQKQIKQSAEAQSQIVSELKNKQYDQLITAESKINNSLSKLNFETNERIEKLSQKTEENNIALATNLTGRIDDLNTKFIGKIDETASVNSHKLNEESQSLKKIIIELRQSVHQSIHNQNNILTDLISNTDNSFEIFQKEMLQFIDDNKQKQSSLEASSNKLINSLRASLDSEITGMNNNLSTQKKQLQQNMNELINTVINQQEKNTYESLEKLKVSFNSSLQDNVNTAIARESELHESTLTKVQDTGDSLANRISDVFENTDQKITQTSDLLKKQITQAEAQANNFATEKVNESYRELMSHIKNRLNHLDLNLKTDTDSKVTQSNEQLKEQILALEAKLNTQNQTISSLEFHQNKISEVFNKTLEDKIKSNPTEIAALLSPIISQIISNAKSDDLNIIAAATSKYIPTHLKQLQENSPDDQKVLAEIFSNGLPKAIELQGSQPDSAFSKSIAPMIGLGLQNQIKVDKDKIVDALYPVIGSTISKYMAESMKELMIKINKKFDDTLSFKKYFARIKSKITGKELLLDDSLNATVQSIYMIHKITGVVILDRHLEESENNNSQMVGGMFTAITSFVNDWIQKEGENKAIDSIEYGDSKVVFESSGSLILAIVVSVGEVQQIKSLARNILIETHSKNYEHISNYNGDSNSLPESFKSSLDSFFN